MLQSDVGPKGIITSSPEQARARAVDKQEQLCELSSHALAVLSSALVSIKIIHLAKKRIKIALYCFEYNDQYLISIV